MSCQTGGQIWMNCATETLQTLSSFASGRLLVGLVLSALLWWCEGFESCQTETTGSSAQWDVPPGPFARHKCSVLFWGHGVIGGVRAKAARVLYVGLKSANGYAKKTDLQQSFSPRYEILRSMCPRALFCALPNLFSLHLTFGPPQRWETVEHWKQRVRTTRQPSVSVGAPGWGRANWFSHLEEGGQCPLEPTVGREGLCPLPQLGPLPARVTWGMQQWHLSGPSTPGTALDLTCIMGRDHLKILVPREQNQKILMCRKGDKDPITVRRITIIHLRFFFPSSLHSYHGGAGRLQKYMCK